MPAESKPADSLVLSYLLLRKAIGVLGIALPFLVAIGTAALEAPGLLSSISSYYYSVMGDVFVGCLCATGVFMWSYRGYELKDVIAAQIAAYSVVGIALFPTSPEVGATAQQILIGRLHLTFAIIFFSTLIYFALVLFRKTNPNVPPTPEKIMRNRVYTVCGYTMLAALILIALVFFVVPDDSPLLALNPVFWLEAVLLEAFGISWLVKGEAILKD